MAGRGPRWLAPLLLVGLGGARRASAEVTVVFSEGSANGTMSFNDVPALFGPTFDAGVSGRVQLADPRDACAPFAKEVPKDTIVVLERGHGCRFVAKVMNAQRAGAKAVVVYDDVYEPLREMAMEPGDPTPNIPATFVDLAAGLDIAKLVDESQGPVYATISPDKLPPSFFDTIGTSFAAAFAAAAVTSLLFVMRTQSARRRRRDQLADEPAQNDDDEPRTMSRAAVRRLPTFAFAEADVEQADASSDRAACAVCLEDYQPGDLLRMLPCGHWFHQPCVDQWLTARSALCPICKADARRGPTPAEGGDASATTGDDNDVTDDEEEEEEEGDCDAAPPSSSSPTERTPLLNGGA